MVNGHCCFIQFTGVSFVLGLLLVTLMQYSHLMNRDMGINTAGLVEVRKLAGH